MGVKHNLVMPKLGLTMTGGILTEWRVEPGQRVRQGEVLFVVETEKVANAIEASADGCIGEIRVLAGATVPVGEVLAWIPTEQNSPDIMLIETAHFRVHRPAAISRNGALIAGLPCVSWRVDLAILANSEVFEAKRC